MAFRPRMLPCSKAYHRDGSSWCVGVRCMKHFSTLIHSTVQSVIESVKVAVSCIFRVNISSLINVNIILKVLNCGLTLQGTS